MNIDKIVKDIEVLTDSLDNTKDLDNAWRKISEALGYLSAKDSMYKFKDNMVCRDSNKEKRNE